MRLWTRLQEVTNPYRNCLLLFNSTQLDLLQQWRNNHSGGPSGRSKTHSQHNVLSTTCPKQQGQETMNQNTSNLFSFDSWLLSWTMCSHNGSWHMDHNTAETLKGRGVITATFQKGHSKITTVQWQGSWVKLGVKGSFKRLQTVVANWANGGTGSWVSCQESLSPKTDEECQFYTTLDLQWLQSNKIQI